MDIGKPRTLDQMLELEGHHAPKQLAEAINWLIGYEEVNGSVRPVSLRCSTSSICSLSIPVWKLLPRNTRSVCPARDF